MSDIIDHLSFMIGNMYCFYKVYCLCKIECEKEFVEHVFCRGSKLFFWLFIIINHHVQLLDIVFIVAELFLYSNNCV